MLIILLGISSTTITNKLITKVLSNGHYDLSSYLSCADKGVLNRPMLTQWPIIRREGAPMKAAKRSLAGLTALIAIASSLLCTAQVAQPNLTTPRSPTLPRQLQTGYAKLPLAFELNKGQTDPAVQFFSRGAGYSVFLTSGGMVLSWHPTAPAVPLPGADTYSQGSVAIATKRVGPNKTPDDKSGDITMVFSLVGASSHPKAVGEDQLAAKVNYFIGNDPAKWH